MRYVANFCFLIVILVAGCKPEARFKVLAFYTGKHDAAHISFVQEANNWFFQQATLHNFKYDTTRSWNYLTEKNLRDVDVVLFLDSRPDDSVQRIVFQNYMEAGGSWMGFHFAGFALTLSAYPQNWDWYHNEFLGSGQYASNTWRPTTAILKKEHEHPATNGLPKILTAAPNEWYRWQNDLRLNQNIKFYCPLIQQVFLWAPDLRPTKSGIVGITRWCGRIKTIA
jgi:hypothetical protein